MAAYAYIKMYVTIVFCKERGSLMKKFIRKFYRKGVAAVLMSVLMVLGAIAPSLADTIKKDGLEVTITTDKEA